MIKLPLDQMTREEKLFALDAIWADLEKEDADLPTPHWHLEELKKTEARAAAGLETFEEAEVVKSALRERFK